MLRDEGTTGRGTSRDGKLEADDVCDMEVGERSFVRSHKGTKYRREFGLIRDKIEGSFARLHSGEVYKFRHYKEVSFSK